jgi:hypothetical protein
MLSLALVLPVMTIDAVVSEASAAAPSSSSVIATVRLPAGSYTARPGLGAMWALTNDEFTYSTLYRIDAVTNRVTETVPLGFPAADLTVGYGSVWVSDYYGSTLVRLSPSGRVQATIPVGLQPQYVHIAFGSVWTSDHHGHSVSRVDPASNRVISTARVGADMFRDGPQDFTDDGSYLYVESSNLPYLQRINPTTGTTRQLAVTGLVYGGDLIWVPGPAGGTLWNALTDPQSGTVMALDGYTVQGAVRVRVALAADEVLGGLAYLGGLVYYGANTTGVTTHAVLRAVDRVSGARVLAVTVPGQVGTLRAGFGDLWVIDRTTSILRRVHVDPPASAAGS